MPTLDDAISRYAAIAMSAERTLGQEPGAAVVDGTRAILRTS
jgi:hypothetical protein